MTEKEEIQELKEKVDKLQRIVAGIIVDLAPQGKIVKLSVEEMKKYNYVEAISSARQNIGK